MATVRRVTDEHGQPERAGRSSDSEQRQEATPALAGEPGPPGATANLSETMGQLARSLQGRHGDVEATLRIITAVAVGAIPGAEECTITYVTGRGTVEPRAATSDLPRELDEIQNELQEGPCLSSVWEEKTVRIEDMRTEERWPRFAARAVDRGVLSALSFQLFVDGDNLGALDCYARTPHAFSEESEDVGLVFASHAAVALSGARHEQNLHQAVSSRDLIGQAKGILMERYKITADQAFQLLAQASQNTNRKLLTIAEELTHTGSVPGQQLGA